jgi:putative transposase
MSVAALALISAAHQSSRMHTRGHGEGALRRHRVSLPEASYFVTLCTEHRKPSLTQPVIADAIRAELSAIEDDGHWKQRGGVLMPDHLHLFVCLSGQLPIARCVARLKAKTKQALQAAHLSWQGNFYEHRLRPNDSVEEVLRYLFLNPYRGIRVPAAETYPWFWLGADEAAWFLPGSDQGRPFPEWLQ